MPSRKSAKKLTVFIIISVIVFISILLGFRYRYEYFHLYIHKGLTIFLDSEFGELLDKYGTDNNIASFERENELGIFVTYPYDDEKYSIVLRLTKYLPSDELLFRAELSSSINTQHNAGNPHIYMNIPMEYFAEILENGLTQNQIIRLTDAANNAGWKELEMNVEVKMKPDIALSYIE
jgi:hypothetical protein